MGKPTTTTVKTDPYQRVTDRILADLERDRQPIGGKLYQHGCSLCTEALHDDRPGQRAAEVTN